MPILPTKRDPRLITIRRGGTLTDAHHHLLAEWAAQCAEHVLHLYEQASPGDTRPRDAIAVTRAWIRGEVPMREAHRTAFRTNAAGRGLTPQGSPRLPPARPSPWPMSPRTISALPPTRSGQPWRMRSRGVRMPRRRAAPNVTGSYSAFPMTSAISSSTTNVAAARSAGTCSTTDALVDSGVKPAAQNGSQAND